MIYELPPAVTFAPDMGFPVFLSVMVPVRVANFTSATLTVLVSPATVVPEVVFVTYPVLVTVNW